MTFKKPFALLTISLLSVILTSCNSNTNPIETDNPEPVYTPKEREVVDITSELAPSFGVIIKGLNQPADESHNAWDNAYTAKCNLSIDGTSEEMASRIDKIASKYNYSVSYGRIEKEYKDGQEVYTNVPVSHDDIDSEYIDSAFLRSNDPNQKYEFIEIFRTSRLTGDYSNGSIYIDGDPGVRLPIYIDYSGRYLIYSYGLFNDCMRDFLEPTFTGITLRVNEDGQITEYSSEEESVIEEYLDAFHTMYAKMVDEEDFDFDTSDSVLDIVFTSNEGIDYVYSFDEYDILHYGSKAYSLSDEEALIEANRKMLGIEDETTVALAEISYKEPSAEDIEIADDGISYVKNQILISGNLDSKYEDVSSLCDEYGFDIVGYIEFSKDYQIEFRDDKTYEELNLLIDEFKEMDFVSYCSLNTASYVSFDE